MILMNKRRNEWINYIFLISKGSFGDVEDDVSKIRVVAMTTINNAAFSAFAANFFRFLSTCKSPISSLAETIQNPLQEEKEEITKTHSLHLFPQT